PRRCRRGGGNWLRWSCGRSRRDSSSECGRRSIRERTIGGSGSRPRKPLFAWPGLRSWFHLACVGFLVDPFARPARVKPGKSRQIVANGRRTLVSALVGWAKAAECKRSGRAHHDCLFSLAGNENGGHAGCASLRPLSPPYGPADLFGRDGRRDLDEVGRALLEERRQRLLGFCRAHALAERLVFHFDGFFD